jgi:hypothetical protein
LFGAIAAAKADSLKPLIGRRAEEWSERSL